MVTYPIDVGDKLISFDPGKTTGIVSAVYTGEANRLFEILYVKDLQWEERSAIPRIIGNVHRYVVTEAFLLYESKALAQTNNKFPSVRIIGWIEAAMHANGMDYCDLIEQPAGERKQVQIMDIHKDRFRHLHHARDAYRHLRLFVLMNTHKSRMAKQ